MAHVETARGRLLPEAIVRRRQVHCLLDITCLIFWLYRSPRGLVVFPEPLQIKYGPLRCFKITWQTGQGSDCTHIGADKKEKLFLFTCISLWAIPKKRFHLSVRWESLFFLWLLLYDRLLCCFEINLNTFFWLLHTVSDQCDAKLQCGNMDFIFIYSCNFFHKTTGTPKAL